MFNSSFAPWKIFAGVGAVLLALLAMLMTAFQRFNDLSNANAWNVHTYQVLLETSNMTRGLINMQTSTRGFLQTGSEEFLQPYFTGRDEFLKRHAKALELTRDNDIQQKRLQLLKRQYDIWTRGHIEPLLKMRRSAANTQAALQMAEPGVRTRKAIMDAMQKTIASIEETELQLLTGRMQHEKSQQALTHATLFYNGIFAVVMAVGLALLLGGNIRNMERLNRQLNEQIERSKKAERETSTLSRHNQMLLEATHEGIVGLNQNGRITFFNPAAEALTGWRADEAIGKALHELLQAKHADGSPYRPEQSPILATLRDGEVRSGDDEVFWNKQGRKIAIEFTSAPLLEDEDGETSKRHGAVVAFRDVSQRKREEATREEIAAIVTYAADAIIRFNLEGVITSWNRAATQLYGFTEAEMVGRNFDRLIPNGKPDETRSLAEKILRKEKVEAYRAVRRRSDGREIEVEVMPSPARDASGAITGVTTISFKAPAPENGAPQIASHVSGQPL